MKAFKVDQNTDRRSLHRESHPQPSDEVQPQTTTEHKTKGSPFPPCQVPPPETVSDFVGRLEQNISRGIERSALAQWSGSILLALLRPAIRFAQACERRLALSLLWTASLLGWPRPWFHELHWDCSLSPEQTEILSSGAKRRMAELRERLESHSESEPKTDRQIPRR